MVTGGRGVADVDDRFRDLCGVPRGQEQQVMQFWLERLHPADRQAVMDLWEELHAGKLETISTEYRYLHPTEGQRWRHHLARVAARDANGRAVRTIGVLQDVTADLARWPWVVRCRCGHAGSRSWSAPWSDAQSRSCLACVDHGSQPPRAAVQDWKRRATRRRPRSCRTGPGLFAGSRPDASPRRAGDYPGQQGRNLASGTNSRFWDMPDGPDGAHECRGDG